jgi:hypothetical protein
MQFGTRKLSSVRVIGTMQEVRLPAPRVLIAAPDFLQIGYFLEGHEDWVTESLAPRDPIPGQLGVATSLRTTSRVVPGAKGLQTGRVDNFATSLRCEACKLW